MEKSKFNTELDKEKRTFNGITFDSKLEMRYYCDVLLPLVESGEVVEYELQKMYVLQDGFVRNGKKVQPITYIADFYIKHADGRVEVIDTKGLPDTTAKIKRKLFWHRYPEIDYNWVVYIQKHGGWITYEEEKSAKRQENLKKKREKSDNGKDAE